MLLYISGRYTAATLAERHENIAKARAIAGKLWAQGHGVICPHTNTANFEDDHPDIDYDAFIRGDLMMVERCDAIVMLPGWEQSKGAKIERTHAEKEGVDVYEWPCEIPLDGLTTSMRVNARMLTPALPPPLTEQEENRFRNDFVKACQELRQQQTPSIIPDDPHAFYRVKDSGQRQQFASGMVRDTTTGKVDVSRVFDGPMLERWAAHLTLGGAKYPDIAPGVANWTLAAGDEERARFRKSAARHFLQWMRGDTDEDHAAAVFFNLNGYEYVADRQRKETTAKAA